jgi:hypothetical protein
MTNDEKSFAIADKIEREVGALYFGRGKPESWLRSDIKSAMLRVSQFSIGVTTGAIPPDPQPVTLADVAESKERKCSDVGTWCD